MPLFYPNLNFDNPDQAFEEKNGAERIVLEALYKDLDDRWLVFHGFNWREVNLKQGEKIGEADVVVFHPQWGILVIEVKDGGIRCESGQWFYIRDYDGIECPMKLSPFDQARRTRYHIETQLKNTVLGPDFTSSTALTHTVWFPDIKWTGPLPSEVPNSAFILDSRHLQNPERHIRSILQQSNPHSKPWDKREKDILLQSLYPDVNLLVPLGNQLGKLRNQLFRMTQDQVNVFKSLRNQKRLLVEGCAGSGKTLLAAALAHEHLNNGKRVLFTCYNKRLATFIAQDFNGASSIDIINFHELAHKLCEEAGIPYEVPTDRELQIDFFQNKCAGLILDCASHTLRHYDTIIVDEAFDFCETWWLALESLGNEGFSYYVFYDRNQAVFTDGNTWKPPFQADPIVLDTDVRNTGPIGRFAAHLGGVDEAGAYGVNDGPAPKLLSYRAVADIPGILLKLINELTGKNKVAPSDIVVLAPYKLDHERLKLNEFVLNREKLFSMELADVDHGKVRIGTIQSFKGLEADVVILCGIDGHLPACSHANLYVGATRARSMLYVIHQGCLS